MKRRSSLLAIVGLVSGIWLTGSFVPLPVASAQTSKTEVKQKGKKKSQEAQENWQSMTPEEQQAAKEKGQAASQKKQQEWQSMTPEEQQAAKAKAKKGAQKGRQKWQSLPE